jgi:hypothetical protein
MGVPEVSSDLSGHITMHQVLRLLYADQLSPIESIFRFESFDRADIRDTVGRLLCGAYDSALYDNEQRIRELTKEHDTISGELKSLFAVFGSTEQGFTPEWLEAQRSALIDEQRSVQAAIEAAEERIFVGKQEDEITLSDQEIVYKEVQRLQVEIGAEKQSSDAITLAIVDSDAFIAGLKTKLEALQDTSKVVQYFGEIRFHSCPACYAPISDEQRAHMCHLCKTPFDSEQTKSRISTLIMDITRQIKQSEQLQVRRSERLAAVDQHIGQLELAWRNASRRLLTLQRLPSTEAGAQLRDLHMRSGYVTRQIEDLDSKTKLVETVRSLTTRRDLVSAEMARLRSANEALRAEQQQRLSRAYSAISDELKQLLRNDLIRQDVFEDPKNITFTFAENKITIDDESYFSASSRAILKK